jgi:hypothetical protein
MSLVGRRIRHVLPYVVVAVATAAVYTRRIEPWLRRWGATDAEQSVALPIDDLVEGDHPRTTRAITIDAPAADVWPWVAQIGQDRAGFYSYTVLENLVGARMHNASTIEPGWQTREVGDSVWLADEQRWHDVGRQVAAIVDEPRALVLVSPADWEHLQSGTKAGGAWGFFVQPVDEHQSRFIVRSSGGAVGTHSFDLLHFVMEQKMMRGIRDRAEAH